MNNKWNQLRYRLQMMTAGSYGNDRLNRHMLVLCIILTVVNILLHNRGVYSIAWLALVVCLFRQFSKNHAARRKELAAYENLLRLPKLFFRYVGLSWKERKTNRLFICSCRTIVRYPKGRGTLEVKCPKCGRVRRVRS